MTIGCPRNSNWFQCSPLLEIHQKCEYEDKSLLWTEKFDHLLIVEEPTYAPQVARSQIPNRCPQSGDISLLATPMANGSLCPNAHLTGIQVGAVVLFLALQHQQARASRCNDGASKFICSVNAVVLLLSQVRKGFDRVVGYFSLQHPKYESFLHQ